MRVFLIYVRDENYYHPPPERLARRRPDNGQLAVMAFPPLGIQTLAPVLRQAGVARREQQHWREPDREVSPYPR